MQRKILCTAISIATGSIGATVSPIAMSQQVGLEEIVVTARKREENLQDVGLSVSALSQTDIDRTFARDIRDLAFASPNLIIDDTSQGPGGNAALYIRGVGVADVEKNFEPAVGVTIDGLFIGANSGAILRSIDLASVEVLRGPQGTFVGQNATGGAVFVTSNNPVIEGGYHGYGQVQVGNYGQWGLQGAVNVPISKTFAARFEFLN